MRLLTFILTAITLTVQAGSNVVLGTVSSLAWVSNSAGNVVANWGTEQYTNGIVAWWKFDEGSGTNVVDSSGNGFNGYLTSASTPTWTNGTSGGYALDFTKTNYVKTTISGTSTGSLATFSAWIMPRSYQNYIGIVYTRTGTARGVSFSGALTYPVTFSWDGGADEYAANTGLVVKTNEWNFVAFSISTNGTDGYLLNTEGLKTWRSTGTNALRSLDGTWAIGQDTFGGATRGFDGFIDNVRFYNVALTSNTIVGIYNLEKP